MMRVIFWICVAAGLAVFLWFDANSAHMTANHKLLVYTLVVDLVMVAFTGYGIGMLVYGVRKGSVILAGKYGARAFSRDLQPIRYWLIMAFYVFWVTGCLYALYARNRDLVQML